MEEVIHIYTDETACLVKKNNGEIIISSPQPIRFSNTEVIALPSKLSVVFPNTDYCCIVNSAEDLIFDYNLEVKSQAFYPAVGEIAQTLVSITILKHSAEDVVLPRFTPLALLTFVSHVNNRVAFHKTKADFKLDPDREEGEAKAVSWNLTDSCDECDCGLSHV